MLIILAQYTIQICPHQIGANKVQKVLLIIAKIFSGVCPYAVNPSVDIPVDLYDWFYPKTIQCVHLFSALFIKKRGEKIWKI